MAKKENVQNFDQILEDCGQFVWIQFIKISVFISCSLHIPGGFGKFQFVILVALLLPEIPAAFVAFAPVFVGEIRYEIIKIAHNFMPCFVTKLCRKTNPWRWLDLFV